LDGDVDAEPGGQFAELIDCFGLVHGKKSRLVDE
jgi:hypothetical protein